MIRWLLKIDPWGFPISERKSSVSETGSKADSVTTETLHIEPTESEKQRALHEKWWDYRDPSRFEKHWDQLMPLNNPNRPEMDPPERVYETWPQERPDFYEDRLYDQNPPWEDEIPWQDMNYGL